MDTCTSTLYIGMRVLELFVAIFPTCQLRFRRARAGVCVCVCVRVCVCVCVTSAWLTCLGETGLGYLSFLRKLGCNAVAVLVASHGLLEEASDVMLALAPAQSRLPGWLPCGAVV